MHVHVHHSGQDLIRLDRLRFTSLDLFEHPPAGGERSRKVSSGTPSPPTGSCRRRASRSAKMVSTSEVSETITLAHGLFAKHTLSTDTSVHAVVCKEDANAGVDPCCHVDLVSQPDC